MLLPAGKPVSDESYEGHHEESIDRLWSHMEAVGDCWEWRGYLNRGGYGTVRFMGSMWMTHRLAYELLVGPVMEGLTLDHLCRNRRCMNPAHLEPCTRAENTMRGDSPFAKHAKKTHCPSGHPYDESNTRFGKNKGGLSRSRLCIECARAYCRAYGANRRRLEPNYKH